METSPSHRDTTRILVNGEPETSRTGCESVPLEEIKKKSTTMDDIQVQLHQERETAVRRSHSLGSVGSKVKSGVYDESFLIGRRENSMINLRPRAHSHIRITEVVPSNSELIPGAQEDQTWRTPVRVFTEKLRGKTKDDKTMNKRLRTFYKEQDELIKAFEDIQLETTDHEVQLKLEAQLLRRAALLAKLSFAINLMLLIAKTVAVALSSSLSIISSLVDSAVDLLSGIIIWWTSRAIKNKNVYDYPGGRSRLEPTAIVILSVIMSLASFQLIVESVQVIIHFSEKSHNPPSIELTVILIAAGTIVSKFILFLLCYFLGRASSSVMALAQDHRNDVMSNIIAIICGYLGSKQFIETTSEYNVVYIDPIGAIIISIYILVNWWRTGYEQIKLLTGHTADTNFLSKITWICLNHHEDIIYIDTVRAFHFGNNFLVEVDIVLPEDMSLKESHNIGETLQQKLEKFKLVERAFVHIDYEITHAPHEEHKVV